VPLTEAPRGEGQRLEGPGDAHDWPWNRRFERFPEDEARPQVPAAGPVSEPAQPASAPAEPSAAEPPAPEEPKGPPRKGWWKRLTDG
jgi:hypothetical protein